jgi:hypothetical protein
VVDVPNDVGVPSVAPETRTADDYLQIQPKAGEGLAQVGQSAVDLSKVFGQVQVDDATTTALNQASDLVDQYKQLKGADALNAQAEYKQKLNDIFANGAKSLTSLNQQAAYAETARTYQTRYFGGAITDHATQASNDYAQETYKSAVDAGTRIIAGDPNNPEALKAGTNQIMSATLKMLQLSGNASDPQIFNDAVQSANQQITLARIQAIGVNDPASALKLANDNQAMLGDKYAPVADGLRARGNEAQGNDLGMAAFTGAASATAAAAPSIPGAAAATTAPATGSPATPATPSATSSPTPSADQVFGAIYGNESGGRITSPTSVNGAKGPMQMLQSTFDSVAKPGQDINNNADNLQVGHTLVNKYYQDYGGDAARVAVAYFSGPGNVAPAGSPTPYLQNFKDGNGTTVSSYVANVLAKLPGGAQASPTANVRADAYSRLLANPDFQNASPEVRERAVEVLNEQLTVQQVADQGTQQQQDMVSQKAANDYTTQMLTAVSNGQAIPPDFLQRVAADPSLKADAKTALFDYALRLTGDSKAVGYGPGYLNAYNSILAPYGTPGKISDPTTILQMAGPGGPLTPTGAQALIQTLQQSQSGIDGAGIEQSKASVLNYAKSKLSFEDDTGTNKIPDPVGERAFDALFVPQFEAGYAAWVKAGKDPMAYLGDTKSIDAMINRIRPASQMAQDKIAAMNGLTGDDTQQTPGVAQNAPPPPPPPGIAADKRGRVVSDTPGQGASKWSQSEWGQALALLMSDPKKYGPYFDARFGADGFSAAQVVQQLSGPDAPPVQMPAYGAATGGFN